MPMTGDICDTTGYYESQCVHRVEAHFDKGDKFTPCPSDGVAVYWKLL